MQQATSGDIADKTNGLLELKLESLTVYVSTNDLPNNVNVLNSKSKIKKFLHWFCSKFFNIVFTKDKINLSKTRIDTNSQNTNSQKLRKFCKWNNINLIINDNIKEEHLGIKKLNLDRKGISVFAKNLLNFIEENWFLSWFRDTCYENENVFNASIPTVSDAKISVISINQYLDF